MTLFLHHTQEVSTLTVSVERQDPVFLDVEQRLRQFPLGVWTGAARATSATRAVETIRLHPIDVRFVGPA